MECKLQQRSQASDWTEDMSLKLEANYVQLDNRRIYYSFQLNVFECLLSYKEHILVSFDTTAYISRHEMAITHSSLISSFIYRT